MIKTMIMLFDNDDDVKLQDDNHVISLFSAFSNIGNVVFMRSIIICYVALIL